jgi:hypothetical protein
MAARAAKPKAKTPPPAPDDDKPEVIREAPPPKGHNGPTHDDIIMAGNEMLKLWAERDAIADKIKTFRGILRGRKFVLGKLDANVKKLLWTPAEIIEDRAVDDHYAAAFHFPIGEVLQQGELFGTEKTPEPVREKMRWKQRGYSAGVAGLGWPDDAPSGCPPECKPDYAQGWEEGAEVVRLAFLDQRKGLQPIAQAGVLTPDEDGDDLDTPTADEQQFEES